MTPAHAARRVNHPISQTEPIPLAFIIAVSALLLFAIAVLIGTRSGPLAAYQRLTTLNQTINTVNVANANNDGNETVPTITLLAMDPPITRPATTVYVTMRVTNNTAQTLTDLSGQLRISWQRLTTRTALADWLAIPGEHTAVTVARQQIPNLAPGQSADVQLQFESDILGFADALSGPRAMSLSVRDGEDQLLTQFNTFLIWDSDIHPPLGNKVPVSLFAPVTGPAIDSLDPLPAIEPLLTPPGRLGSVLQAVNTAATTTGVPNALAIAIDPALVGYIFGIDYPGAENWLSSVAVAAEQSLVYSLPPFDPDIAALAHANLTAEELQMATSVPLPNNFRIPDNWRPPVAWPADWLIPDAATHQAALDAGYSMMVNPAGSRALWGTATGLDVYGTSTHNMAVLINDLNLARNFTAATDSDQPNSADALQKLLSELLVISEQYGSSPPYILLALPRDWNPNTGLLERALGAMVASEWITISPLTTLLTQPVPRVDRMSIPQFFIHQNELPANQVQELIAGIQKVDSFTDIASDPYYVVADTEAKLITPLSIPWRFTPNSYLTRADVVDRSLQITADISRSLTISAAGATLITAEGSIPLLVHNGFASAVTVQVVLTPQDSRLLVDDEPVVTVPAAATQIVYVPVRAIASGDIEVGIQLHSSEGGVVADAGLLELRVRAGWETAGTAVFMGLLGLLMTFGIARTVRRGRSPRRANAASVSYPRIYDR